MKRNFSVSKSFNPYMVFFSCSDACGLRSACSQCQKADSFTAFSSFTRIDSRLYVCLCVGLFLLLHPVTSPAKLFFEVLQLQSVQHECKSQRAYITQWSAEILILVYTRLVHKSFWMSSVSHVVLHGLVSSSFLFKSCFQYTDVPASECSKQHYPQLSVINSRDLGD